MDIQGGGPIHQLYCISYPRTTIILSWHTKVVLSHQIIVHHTLLLSIRPHTCQHPSHLQRMLHRFCHEWEQHPRGPCHPHHSSHGGRGPRVLTQRAKLAAEFVRHNVGVGCQGVTQCGVPGRSAQRAQRVLRGCSNDWACVRCAGAWFWGTCSSVDIEFQWKDISEWVSSCHMTTHYQHVSETSTNSTKTPV